MAGSGASPSLPGARRRSLDHALQTSTITDLRPDEPPEGQLDGGEGNEGGQGFGKVLEILGKPPVSAEPGEGALDHPAAGQDDGAPHVVAPFDDLHAQQGHLCHRSVTLPRVVAAISPDQFEPWEAPSYLVEH